MAETKRLIEIDCLRIVAFFATAEDIKRLMAWVKADMFHDDDFFFKNCHFESQSIAGKNLAHCQQLC
ncbi:hypothetical protein RCO48_39235 [Peribacillus frigoritolerans]|nr:hypothetical protein [Peribacillus frigoritolerans]